MSSCAELADYDWLTGPDAAVWLRDLAGSNEPLHTAAARLRRDLPAERVHLLLELVELRKRAAGKFARANAMFFTPLGLEQATDQWVAAHKARRFAGRGQIADLCCGIGGDLLALGGVAKSTGIDRDPIAASLAAANARVYGADVTVQICDVEQIDAHEFGAWHIDPDRRPGGKRTTSIEWSTPSLETVEGLLAARSNAAIKLAPAAEAPISWLDRCELEWISRDRECRQLVAWHGELAESPGQRRATVLANDGVVERTIVGHPDELMPFATELDRYLFEPDAAVLAARLSAAFATEQKLSAFSAGIAYLTGPRAIDDPALACFEIDEVLPLRPPLVAKYLRERRIGRLEIKKRGVDHHPDTVRKQLNLAGDESATLVLTKLKGKHVAIVARRVTANSSSSSLLPAS